MTPLLTLAALQQGAQQSNAAGTGWSAFFWFWLALIAVVFLFFVARFASRRRGPPPIEPGA